MYFLLASIIILVTQGFLGMADWGILVSNWFIAGLVSAIAAGSLSAERIFNFNSLPCIFHSWTLLASVMNLVAIHIQTELEWWQMWLLMSGIGVIMVICTSIWQARDLTARSLALGIIISILTLIYVPSVLWLVLVIIGLTMLSSFTMHSFYALISGFVTGVWLCYIILELSSGGLGDTYILSFIDDWDNLTVDWPQIQSSGWSGWIMVGICSIIFFVYMTVRLYRSSFSSLRMRSISLWLCCLALAFILLLTFDWALYLLLISVVMMIHLLLVLGNDPDQLARKGYYTILYVLLVLGVAEPLILMGYDYLSTISIELPFDLPW